MNLSNVKDGSDYIDLSISYIRLDSDNQTYKTKVYFFPTAKRNCSKLDIKLLCILDKHNKILDYSNEYLKYDFFKGFRDNSYTFLEGDVGDKIKYIVIRVKDNYTDIETAKIAV